MKNSKLLMTSVFITVLAFIGPVTAGPLNCTLAPPTSKASLMCEWEACGEVGSSTECSSYKLKYYRNFDLKTTNHSVTRAIIAVHGRRGERENDDDRPFDYYNHIARAAADNGLQSSTLIIAPFFDRTKKCQVDSTNPNRCESPRVTVNNSWCGGQGGANDDGRLCWNSWDGSDANDYPAGGNADNDRESPYTSSFAIMDDIIYYLDPSRNNFFPNLETIIITGQSAGGQFVQRYAMAGAASAAKITMRYVPCNPGSIAYMSASRPTQASIDAFPNIQFQKDCDGDGTIQADEISDPPSGSIGILADVESWSTYPYSFMIPYDYQWEGDRCYSDGSYDAWPWGLGDLTTNDYVSARVGSSGVARSRYLKRNVVILFGIDDNDYVAPNFSCEDSSEWNCMHATQGQTRVERGTLFFNHVCDTYDCSNHGFATVCIDTNNDNKCDQRIGHGGEGMYNSIATRRILLFDAKPPSLSYQKPLKGKPGVWMRVSLGNLPHNFLPKSVFIPESGAGYTLKTYKNKSYFDIRPNSDFTGRLSVPVRVRSPYHPSQSKLTFISNRFFLKISVDTKMEWLFPEVLSGLLLSD